MFSIFFQDDGHAISLLSPGFMMVCIVSLVRSLFHSILLPSMSATRNRFFLLELLFPWPQHRFGASKPTESGRHPLQVYPILLFPNMLFATLSHHDSLMTRRYPVLSSKPRVGSARSCRRSGMTDTGWRKKKRSEATVGDIFMPEAKGLSFGLPPARGPWI